MDLESFNTSRESLVPLLALSNKTNKNIIIFPTDKEAIEFATDFSNLNNVELPKKESNFIVTETSSEGSPNFITDAHKYRFEYDPRRDAKERQSNVNQAILCPHCNVGIGIPPIRPIKIMCPSCRIESIFEN